MMKKLLPLCVVALVANATFGWSELYVSSGSLYVPTVRGWFTDESVGTNAFFFACIVDAETYAQYANDSPSLYQAYLNGAFNDVEDDEKIVGRTKTDGFYRGTLIDGLTEGTYYVAMVATYTPAVGTRDYYIAKIESGEYTETMEEQFDNLYFSLNPTKWHYLGEELEPPDLTCSSLSVTGGNVTASYEISDFPWLEANMVNDNGSNTISVIAASDLERTNTTNILANVTATDSATSTFTVTFPAPDATAYPSLFLFGLEKP